MDCVIQILLADNNSYYIEREESSNTVSIKKYLLQKEKGDLFQIISDKKLLRLKNKAEQTKLKPIKSQTSRSWKPEVKIIKTCK